MNSSVFEKTMKNLRKHRDIRPVTIGRKRNLLATECNYHTTKWFTEKLLTTVMNKTEVKVNKPVYLGLSILGMSKIVMYEHWHGFAKPKYGKALLHGYGQAVSKFMLNRKTSVETSSDVE